MKDFFFRWHIFIAVLILFGIVLFVSIHWQDVDTRIIFAILTGTGAVVFFVQKQALEEARLFRELFKEFNSRYDILNEELNLVVKKRTLTSKDKHTLYDYFNLCGEEYLMVKRGYIYPEVWKSWQNGMKVFLKSD